MSSQLVGVSSDNSPDSYGTGTSRAVQRLETIVKVLGALLAVDVALGLPATIFQFTKAGLPMQFITREQAIRAGLLPSATMAAMAGLAYLIAGRRIGHQDGSRGNRQLTAAHFASWAAVWYIAMLWVLASAYLLHKMHLNYVTTFQAALHPGWKVRLLLSFTALTFGAVGVPFVRAVWRHFEKISTPAGQRIAKLSIAMCSAAVLMLFWAAKKVVIPEAAEEPFVDALAAAIFFGLYVVLFILALDFRSITPDAEKIGRRQLLAVILLTYLSALVFYSLFWYARLPEYFGGGKPVAITLWPAKTALTEPSVLHCKTSSPEHLRCDVYLLLITSDYYIVTLEDVPNSSGFVVPRQSIALISGAR